MTGERAHHFLLDIVPALLLSCLGGTPLSVLAGASAVMRAVPGARHAPQMGKQT